LPTEASKGQTKQGNRRAIWEGNSWMQYLEAAAAAEATAVLPGPAGGEESPIDLGGHGAVPARPAATWLSISND